MASDERTFLDEVYGVEDAETTRSLYADWAATYDDETRAAGYVTPGRCAGALADAVDDLSAPIHDLGCGTGLSGEALKAAGFSTVDGSDFSQAMLDFAHTKEGVYRSLMLADMNNPLPFAAGEYAHVAAVGVFSPGHAPPETIDDVMDRLPVGGCFVFSMNDHALEIPGYQQHIDALVQAGRAETAFREYGDHLPKHGLKSMVVVLRRL